MLAAATRAILVQQQPTRTFELDEGWSIPRSSCKRYFKYMCFGNTEVHNPYKQGSQAVQAIYLHTLADTLRLTLHDSCYCNILTNHNQSDRLAFNRGALGLIAARTLDATPAIRLARWLKLSEFEKSSCRRQSEHPHTETDCVNLLHKILYYITATKSRLRGRVCASTAPRPHAAMH